MILNTGFIKLISDQFRLDINGEHGLSHWRAVEKIGLYLARHTGTDKKVVRYFSYLHDSQRSSDDYDPDHGHRSGEYVGHLWDGGLIELSHEQLKSLVFACKHHNNSEIKSLDATIQSCWDADRLDLWRYSETPEKDLLNTPFAKTEETIEYARNIRNMG